MSCDDKEIPNLIDIKSINDNIELSFNITAEIEIEQKKGFFIKQITKIKISNDYIFILDKSLSSLFQFKKDGSFIRKFDKFGEAPDEFLNLNDFDLDRANKKIYTLSLDDRKVNIYNFEGEFLETIRLDFQIFQIALLNNNCLAMRGSFFDENYHNIKIFDIEKKKVTNELSKFPKNIFPINLQNITGSFNSSKRLLINEPITYDIYTINDNSLELKYKFDVEDNEKWDETKKFNFNDFFQQITFNRYTYISTSILENDDWVYLKYNKANSEKMVNFKHVFFNKDKQATVKTNFDNNEEFKNTIEVFNNFFVAYKFYERDDSEQIKLYYYSVNQLD